MRVGEAGLPWAIIPAAGRGTRMRPATDVLPKVLLPVGLRPMIDWAIDEAIGRKPKGHDFVIDRKTRRPSVARHMSVTGG